MKVQFDFMHRMLGTQKYFTVLIANIIKKCDENCLSCPQILVYPLVDWRCQGASFDEFLFPGTSLNLPETIRMWVILESFCEVL